MHTQEFDEAALDGQLRELKRAMEHEAAPERVEAAVIAAFRGRHVTRPSAWWPRWALAAAAVVVLIGTSWIVFRSGAPQPAPAAAPVAEFIPLVPDPALRPGESAQILRVSLPRTALQRFGLPVDESRVSETVRADIIVGQDMVARAIRIVR